MKIAMCLLGLLMSGTALSYSYSDMCVDYVNAVNGGVNEAVYSYCEGYTTSESLTCLQVVVTSEGLDAARLDACQTINTIEEVQCVVEERRNTYNSDKDFFVNKIYNCNQ